MSAVFFDGLQFVVNNLSTDVYIFIGFDPRPQDTRHLDPSKKPVTTPLMPAFYEPRLVVQSKSHDGNNSTSPLAPTSYRSTQRRTKRRKCSTPTNYILKASEAITRRQRRGLIHTALIEIQPPQTSKKASGT
ncbi:hypothetical protein GE21DRAFT_1327138 [Neurospora crassa]|nr:hypothetical protein GE21DRAFT_1327138 [Neurospora crassa]